MKVLKLILSLIGIMSYTCYAQSDQKETSSLTVHFNYQHKKLPDSLSIWTYPKRNYWETSTDYNIKIGKDSTFKLEFPSFTTLLNYRLNTVFGPDCSQIGNYYAVPGDHVRLEVYETSGEDSLIFTGRGASKYQLIEQLKKTEESILHTLKVPKNNIAVATLDSCLNNVYSTILKAKSDKQELIKHYQGSVNADLRLLIGYGYANYDYHWADYLMRLTSVFSGKADQLAQITAHFNKYYPEANGHIAEVSLYSHRYYQLLLAMISFKFKVNSPSREVDLEQVYNELKNYSTNPKIRDLMLSHFFAYEGRISTNYSQSVFDSLLNDATPLLTSESGKQVISSKLFYKKGLPFYDATFLDLDGKPFDTRTLRGQVFLIDAWGEGCGGCLMFHDWFETNVWPKVKDIKNFTVLSIFDGKDKQAWDRGIQSGKYTSLHYLNVSDMPYRLANHPFFKHYQVNSLPFLLLVDKQGKIVAKLKGISNVDDFTRLIVKLADEELKPL